MWGMNFTMGTLLIYASVHSLERCPWMQHFNFVYAQLQAFRVSDTRIHTIGIIGLVCRVNLLPVGSLECH